MKPFILACLVFVCLPALRAAEIHDAADKGDTDAILALLKKDPGLVDLKDKAGDRPLHHAIQSRQIAAAQVLLDSGADVDARGFDEWTPLHWAAKVGSKPLCQLLLEHGANLNALNGVLRTPSQTATGLAVSFLRDWKPPLPKGAQAFFQAAQDGKIQEARLLLAKEPGLLNLRDEDGDTALLHATKAGHAETVGFLIQQGADINALDSDRQTALSWACHKGDVEVVKRILPRAKEEAHSEADRQALVKLAANAAPAVVKAFAAAGLELQMAPAKPPAPPTPPAPPKVVVQAEAAKPAEKVPAPNPDINRRDADGSTPMHHAVQARNPAEVAALLKQGAKPDLLNKAGETPLMIAAQLGDAESLALLLHAGAAPGTRTKGGVNALMLAVTYGRAAAARLLIEAGTDVSLTATEARLTPLHIAASSGAALRAASADPAPGTDADYLAIAGMLLQHHADPNATSPKGSPLMIAVRTAPPEMAALLLDHGADIETVWTKLGYTPLLAAVAAGRVPTLELLIKRGANLKARTPQGAGALHVAAQFNQPAAILSLLVAGMKVDALDSSHATPLIIASATGHLEAVKVLLEHGADPNATANQLMTPLKVARMSHHDAIATYLREHGAKE